MTKIKICGITNKQDLELAISLGADAIGFNFYEKSPRYLMPELAGELRSRMPAGVWAVGVFVAERRESIAEIIELSGVDTLQLLSEDLTGEDLTQKCSLPGDLSQSEQSPWWGKRVIRAYRLPVSQGVLPPSPSQGDYLLFDRRKAGEFGGTGEELEEEVLTSPAVAALLPRAFLAGGINPRNVADKIRRFQPFGIDLASGVESEPGIKDAAKMESLFRALRGL